MKLCDKCLLIMLLALLLITSNRVVSYAQEPTPFPNCRLGVGGDRTYVGNFDMAQLNMGLYLDWGTSADPVTELGLPGTIGYIQEIRVHQNKVGGWDSAYVEPPSYSVSPNPTRIAEIAAAQPGSLWLLGNEVDRRDWDGGRQDEMTPELYATAFHNLQGVIKSADPTARIAIGSVIEGTPLRLAYLDRVWDSYYAQYGYSMGADIDVWNIHGFLLREVRHTWGAEIPAGFDNEDTDPTNNYNPADGFLYGADTATLVAEHRNLDRFKEHVVAMRTWMAEHGERNKPLINTEYGVLYRSLNGVSITTQQVQNYLTGSFDYLLSQKDNVIGYPADENRLVQHWVWYSLNDAYWNGTLFNPTTFALTSYGTTWKSYVSSAAHPLASIPQQNLLATNLRATPLSALPGEDVTVTLRADIANSGNSATETGDAISVSFWNGYPGEAGSVKIGSAVILEDIPGCGSYTTVEMNWPGRSTGTYNWYVKIEPITGEINEADNIRGSVLTIQLGNYQGGQLTLIKDAAIEHTFEFTGTLGAFELTAQSAWDRHTFGPLPAGIYTLSEVAASFPDTSWRLSDVSCHDESYRTIPVDLDLTHYQMAIPLEAGQHITCTIFNVQAVSEDPANPTIYLPMILKNWAH